MNNIQIQPRQEILLHKQKQGSSAKTCLLSAIALECFNLFTYMNKDLSLFVTSPLISAGLALLGTESIPEARIKVTAFSIVSTMATNYILYNNPFCIAGSILVGSSSPIFFAKMYGL